MATPPSEKDFHPGHLFSGCGINFAEDKIKVIRILRGYSDALVSEYFKRIDAPVYEPSTPFINIIIRM